MAPLYRRASVGPPFGRMTFWAYPSERARLDLLAEVEAGTPTLPPHREYRTEVQAPDPILRHKVDHLLKLADGVPKVDALPQLRDGLLREVKERAAVDPGLEWVELTQRDKLAEGDEATQPGIPWALVYMGDKPLDAVRVSGSD